MNSAKPADETEKIGWGHITGVSFGAAALGLVLSFSIPLSPIELLLSLFFLGGVAGALAHRHGWFTGIWIGLPMAVVELSQQALHEFGSFSHMLAAPDYWRIAVPAAILSTSMACLGGMFGAWVRDSRWQPEE